MERIPPVDTLWVAESSGGLDGGLERVPAMGEPGEAPVVLDSTFSQLFYPAGCCSRGVNVPGCGGAHLCSQNSRGRGR